MPTINKYKLISFIMSSISCVLAAVQSLFIYNLSLKISKVEIIKFKLQKIDLSKLAMIS